LKEILFPSPPATFLQIILPRSPPC
jgi:hypothetical protein